MTAGPDEALIKQARRIFRERTDWLFGGFEAWGRPLQAGRHRHRRIDSVAGAVFAFTRSRFNDGNSQRCCGPSGIDYRFNASCEQAY
jgi:hypothetical protein